MDFRQLEAFVKVVELASFSKAAEELYVSQPSISAYIAALEKELHTVLINRSTKVLATTLAGERFLAKAKEMLALKHETSEMLKNLANDVSGDIRILASSVPALYILPPLLAEFHRLYPKISFAMRQADTGGVVQGIAAHRADIGFAGSILGDKKCAFREFAAEKLVFIAPNNSFYEPEKKYSLEELLTGHNFIAREFGSGTRMQYEKFFLENDIDLAKIKTLTSMDNTHSIISAVINGLGISVVSELSVRPLLKRNILRQIKLQLELPTRKIYLVSNKNILPSHLLELFIDYILTNAPAYLQAK
ncbi:MAG: LysR family transcriptional regulator [Sporomusaceae bacterium]|jgi:DNA-binding transcriptional LysR family regulator|nr:LysR family transcriptional regulator [Sporomusaceae bacterium]